MSIDSPALFAVAPAVDPAGTLTYTPLATASSTATIGVRVRDSGGTEHGGVDSSSLQTFTITIQPAEGGGYQVLLPLVVRQGS